MTIQEIIKKSLNNANHKNYNVIDFIDQKTFFIPFKKNNPFILKQEEQYFIFYLEKDIHFSDRLLDLIKVGEIENFIEENLDDLFFDQNRDFNLIKTKESFSELLFYQKENELNEVKKHYVINNSTDQIVREFNLLHSMQNLPISRLITKYGITESFYHLGNNGKLVLSFHSKEDKPFEITNNGYTTIKNYLIPYLKEIRSAYYKPSLIQIKDGEIINFNYIVNNQDYTEKAKVLLDKFNITNPELHHFKDEEIKAFKDLFGI